MYVYDDDIRASKKDMERRELLLTNVDEVVVVSVGQIEFRIFLGKA